jgi:hypothetical protein
VSEGVFENDGMMVDLPKVVSGILRLYHRSTAWQGGFGL